MGRCDFSHVLGAGFLPWRGEARSAGPDFSAMRNRGKNRQRRGLPPPCGIHPAVLGGRAPFSIRPLVRWGHIDGLPVYGLHLLLCWCILLPPGPYSGETLFPAIGGRLPAAGTPLLQGRPGGGKHPAIGPAAQGSLVWWHKQEPQQGSRAEFRLDAGTASYPREVLRGERPKRVLVSFARSKETPSGKRPHQAGKPDTWMGRRSIPPPQLTLCHLPLHKGGFVSGRGKHKSPGESICFLRGFVMRWVSET